MKGVFAHEAENQYKNTETLGMEFHAYRTPRGNCDHCDPRGDAAAGFELGAGEGKRDQLQKQSETNGTCDEQLCM